MSALYWALGSIYLVLDTTNPSWVQRYKVQPGKNEPVDPKKLRNVLKTVLFNQFIVGPLFVTIFYPFACMRGMDKKIRPLPTILEFVLHFAGSIIVREIYFYYSHRLLHMPPFYRWFHKKHHEWTAPVALSAVYATTFEHLVCNLAPVGLGPFLFNSHFFTSLAFSIYAIVMTLQDHSGYKFPYYFDPTMHDLHHEK